MWKNYFSDMATIYGIDIIPACKNFDEENNKIFIGKIKISLIICMLIIPGSVPLKWIVLQKLLTPYINMIVSLQ